MVYKFRQRLNTTLLKYKRPSSTYKNKEIEYVGKWIGTQQHKYKKKKYIMKHGKIHAVWPNLLTEHQEYVSNTKIIK